MSRRTTARITIRFMPEDLDTIARAAEAAGLPVGTWVKARALPAAGRKFTPSRRRATALAHALGDAIGALGPIGNNLNQIARAANSGRFVAPDALDTAAVELRHLRLAFVRAVEGVENSES